MNQKQILDTFLKEEGVELNETQLTQFNQLIILGEQDSDPATETRKITTNEAGMAESFKLSNVAQISTYELIGFLGKEVGILFFENTAQKMIYGIFMLLHEFYPHLKKTFNENQTKVIYSIAQLPNENFTTEELIGRYQEIFEEGIAEEKMEDLLDDLTRYKVLERTALKTYILIEKIKNLSKPV